MCGKEFNRGSIGVQSGFNRRTRALGGIMKGTLKTTFSASISTLRMASSSGRAGFSLKRRELRARRSRMVLHPRRSSASRIIVQHGPVVPRD